MNAIILRKMIVAIALVGVLTACVQADKLQLQENLSKSVSIKLKDVTIAEALEKIGQKVDIKIVLSDEAAWKLPYAEATRLSVALDGPLASSLTEMLNAFFMRYAVGDEEITIYPRPELEHILGRPTTKQLELLTKIYQGSITVRGQVDSRTIINKMLGQEVLILPVRYYDSLSEHMSELVDWELPEDESSPPFTLAQMLDSVGGAWYISGMDFPGQSPEIRVVSMDVFPKLKLNQKVDISYKNERSDKIFQDLANRAGVPLIVHPGSCLHEYELSLSMQNTTISQAVRNIVNIVDADCDIGLRGIEIVGPGPKAKAPSIKAPPRKPDDGAYVGKISIPMDNGKYFLEFMLREKDLTEELQKIRAEKMKEILGDLPEPKPAATPK